MKMGSRSVSYRSHVRHTLGVEPYEVGGRFNLESFLISLLLGCSLSGVGICGFCYFDTSGELIPYFTDVPMYIPKCPVWYNYALRNSHLTN
jgi:hypothetical protein